MSLILYQFSRPFAYLRIDHPDKAIYNWWIPLALSAVTVALSVLFIPLNSILGSGGLIDSITNFIANLPGFFIAALAAIATFNRPDIDELMGDHPPKMNVMFQGQPQNIELTRRRFLCILFAYLTAISILLVLVTKIALYVEINSSQAYLITGWVGCSLYFFFLWQMIVSTLLGLYYLGERIHTQE
ncbi:hypothetical protein BCU92_00340 [Vibrio cyclitrophicus]|uniref:hypothetical protein n=1 Tax=Vibrio cyclitrophicus TaxID=47951 RepID=UPI000C8605C9|nr:hypothetical protein [Vibrio cyclitrophicus]PMG46834.1 hypothetical protein BCU92_12700 [Vibrio cyclitrophicus]